MVGAIGAERIALSEAPPAATDSLLPQAEHRVSRHRQQNTEARNSAPSRWIGFRRSSDRGPEETHERDE
jgi:hypothetical protein